MNRLGGHRARSSHKRNPLWKGLAVFAACLLASCAQVPRAPEPTPSMPPTEAVDTRGAQIYTIAAQDSLAHILVYRGGTLARLGHNHVMSSKSVSGRAWLHPTFERSGFELSIPVQSLIVDDPQARQAAGEDFPPGISQKDIEGTRKNMMRAEVLDGERYPTITLHAANVGGSLQNPIVTARITIKNVTREVTIPMKLAVQGSQLRASGEFDILQTEFGIKPFSIALGALEVQDKLHLKFDIVAFRERT